MSRCSCLKINYYTSFLALSVIITVCIGKRFLWILLVKYELAFLLYGCVDHIFLFTLENLQSNILLVLSLSLSLSLSLQDAVVDKKRPTIYAFVEAGKDYFPKLCKALMALVYYTPVFHEDQKHLSSIVDGMYACMLLCYHLVVQYSQLQCGIFTCTAYNILHNYYNNNWLQLVLTTLHMCIHVCNQQYNIIHA